ncbi:MAG: DUF3450 family protein [Planctomycetota bacterium]
MKTSIDSRIRTDARVHLGRRSFLLLAVSMLVLSAPERILGASKEEERLLGAVRQTESELLKEREDLSGDMERQGTVEAELRRKINDLVAECQTLETRIDKGESALDSTGSDRTAAETERNDLLQSESEIRRWILERIRALASKVQLGVPHARRAERSSILRGMETSALSPQADLARLLGDFLSVSVDEVELGSESEKWTAVVLTASGKSDEADCLRFGKIFGAYRTRDGLHSAVLLPGIGESGGYEWRESAEAGIVVDKFGGAGRGVHLIPLDVTQEIAADRFEIRKDAVTTIISGGLVMIPLGLVALAALILIAERIVALARMRSQQERIERTVLAPLREGKFEVASLAASEVRGPSARVVKAGLAAREGGKEAVEEAIEEAAVRALPRLERFLSAIAALAAVAPLLGLLGTVTGMISTFDVITLFGTGDPRLLSGGISEALVTTQVGLIIAIPLLLIHRILSGAVERRITAMETLGVSLVNVLFHITIRPPDGAASPDGEP